MPKMRTLRETTREKKINKEMLVIFPTNNHLITSISVSATKHAIMENS